MKSTCYQKCGHIDIFSWKYGWSPKICTFPWRHILRECSLPKVLVGIFPEGTFFGENQFGVANLGYSDFGILRHQKVASLINCDLGPIGRLHFEIYLSRWLMLIKATFDFDRCRASGERGNAWLKLVREEWRAEGNSSNRYDRERNRPSPALAYSPASSVNFSDAPNLPNGARMTDWFLGVSVHSLRGAFETYSISDRKGPRGRRGSTKFPVFADTYNSDKRGRGRVKEIHKFCRLHIILIQINLLLFF